ncbi:glycosyl hydrolase-related protein [Streptomyces sp. NBS 14/10]|uniref:alpha-mannosidase n=1 Tax=Streptomyces sp. NBS 14/10 TaxID=1945643 RepID=UPI000B7CBB9C|nr:alpha-mannosidase [Streptomyces sp. NBS 14/10]KAK1185120.1 glycosyl hydrolase-related protein [Streptomyces sp. NBS 14/10]
MHNHFSRTLERLDRVRRERILPQVHRRLGAVEIEAWAVGDDGEPVSPRHALGLTPEPRRGRPDYRPFALGDAWGPPWSTTWFRIRGEVEPQTPGAIDLLLDLGWFDHSVGGHCEGLVFTPDGTIVKGLHPRQTAIRLGEGPAGCGLLDSDGHFELYVEAAANPLLLGLPPFVVTEHGEKGAQEPFEQFRLRRAETAVFSPEVYALLSDLDVLGGLAAELTEDEPRHWRLLRGIEHALDVYDEADAEGSAHRARAVLAPLLAAPAHSSAHRITAVGHAHMDSAWLWPLRETVRKLARTVSNALALLDAHPDLVYTMSAAQHFAWLEEHYPELFARVRDHVERGQLVPVGGMWVEPDGVIPTGESLVRQLTYGKRYFLDRFGIEAREVWLPDSFGYSGALPQLARRAGARWFLTQKISWNDTTTFPHHSFWWEGIDGTRIFTHFPPAETYAAEVTARELRHAVTTFKDKAIASHSLLPYGYGDGGGGPTREMAERLRRLADLEGAPRVVSRTPAEFFEDAEAELREVESVAPPLAPVHRGELYLELHRGTLTSQVAMKRHNRACESLLRAAEYLSAAATVLRGAPYPKDRLDEIWRTVLLHQFHDILPGTSISWVHREARDTYRATEARLRELIDEAAKALGTTTDRKTAGRTAELLPPFVSARTADAESDPDPVRIADGEAGATVLDDGLLRVVIDADGHITSLVDLRGGREVVPPGGRAGVLQLFRDEPVRWDAWDVDRHALRHFQVVDDVTSRTVVQDGPDAGVEVVRRFGASTVTLTMWLRAGTGRFETECEVDWQERERLLKVALPVHVVARTARYETQYGYVERPLLVNTGAEDAMFEAAMHRYIQVADGAFGLAILNDTMYGADARADRDSTVVRLSLLRGSRFPDPDADVGRHHFRWALLPGADVPAAVEAASLFNAPDIAALPPREPLVAIEPLTGHAIVDWVKLADDGSGDLVVRVYETQGARARALLRPCAGLAADAVVWETDLLERALPTEEAAEDAAKDHLSTALPRTSAGARRPADGAALELGPFQVATLRIAPRPEGATTHPMSGEDE